MASRSGTGETELGPSPTELPSGRSAASRAGPHADQGPEPRPAGGNDRLDLIGPARSHNRLAAEPAATDRRPRCSAGLWVARCKNSAGLGSSRQRRRDHSFRLCCLGLEPEVQRPAACPHSPPRARGCNFTRRNALVTAGVSRMGDRSSQRRREPLQAGLEKSSKRIHKRQGEIAAGCSPSHQFSLRSRAPPLARGCTITCAPLDTGNRGSPPAVYGHHESGRVRPAAPGGREGGQRTRPSTSVRGGAWGRTLKSNEAVPQNSLDTLERARPLHFPDLPMGRLPSQAAAAGEALRSLAWRPCADRMGAQNQRSFHGRRTQPSWPSARWRPTGLVGEIPRPLRAQGASKLVASSSWCPA